MTTLVPGEKQVPVTQNSDSGSSQDSSNEPSVRDQKGPNPFTDAVTTQYWRDIYENAKYEGRHRFDPEFTWTPEEERKLVRQVGAPIQGIGIVANYVQLDWRITLWAWLMFVSLDLNRKNINRAISDNMLKELSTLQRLSER
jgi:hypothetical protein